MLKKLLIGAAILISIPLLILGVLISVSIFEAGSEEANHTAFHEYDDKTDSLVEVALHEYFAQPELPKSIVNALDASEPHLSSQVARILLGHKRIGHHRGMLYWHFMHAIDTVASYLRFNREKQVEIVANRSFWGLDGSHVIFGVSDASEYYFKKQLSALDLAEAAALVGLHWNPIHYSPAKCLERTKERQGKVLSEMAEFGFITNAEKDRASLAKLEFAIPTKASCK